MYPMSNAINKACGTVRYRLMHIHHHDVAFTKPCVSIVCETSDEGFCPEKGRRTLIFGKELPPTRFGTGIEHSFFTHFVELPSPQ